MLPGIVSAKPSLSDIGSKITIENDSFKNQTSISTPLILSRKGFTDTFPVKIAFRALYKSDKREYIQLYVTKLDVSWGFYHSAIGEDGYEFKFFKVDSEVGTGGGMVTTSEHFALEMDHDYLKKMSEKEWNIKVYGKKNEGVFRVPSELTKAFLEKLDCYESKECL